MEGCTDNARLLCYERRVGICGLGACLLKCFGGSNLHNTAAAARSLFMHLWGREKEINHVETIVINRLADTASPQTLGD